MVLDFNTSQGGLDEAPGGHLQAGDSPFTALQASMLTVLNKSDPGTYTDELVSKAWSNVDKTHLDWQSVKDRHGIPDGHLMHLAHQMAGNKQQTGSLRMNLNSRGENITSTSTPGGERAQPFVPDASVTFPKMSPISGATRPDGKGRINS